MPHTYGIDAIITTLQAGLKTHLSKVFDRSNEDSKRYNVIHNTEGLMRLGLSPSLSHTPPPFIPGLLPHLDLSGKGYYSFDDSPGEQVGGWLSSQPLSACGTQSR